MTPARRPWTGGRLEGYGIITRQRSRAFYAENTSAWEVEWGESPRKRGEKKKRKKKKAPVRPIATCSLHQPIMTGIFLRNHAWRSFPCRKSPRLQPYCPTVGRQGGAGDGLPEDTPLSPDWDGWSVASARSQEYEFPAMHLPDDPSAGPFFTRASSGHINVGHGFACYALETRRGFGLGLPRWPSPYSSRQAHGKSRSATCTLAGYAPNVAALST